MNLSEIFYSLQLEGPSSGIPAIFIRLAGCNLCCGGPSAELLLKGKATWWCDTEPVWRKGNQTSNEEILEKIKGFGPQVLDWVLKGRVRLIFTGGEPTLPAHQKSIKEFLMFLGDIAREEFPFESYSELETNGTLVAENWLYDYIDQINCSPKLSNSGMLEEKRINPSAIKQIMEHHLYWFKFVISKEEDLIEAENTYIKPFNIPSDSIILMPAMSKASETQETGKMIFDLAKKYGYRATLRSHIVVYDQVTGV